MISRVSEEKGSRAYTAFVIRLFEFIRAPFGFQNSTAAFIQNLINEDVMLLYIDDIVVYAISEEECLQKSEQVLKEQSPSIVNDNMERCIFLQQRIFFWSIISKMVRFFRDQGKITAVSRFRIPKKSKAEQSFLGLPGDSLGSLCQTMPKQLAHSQICFGPEELLSMDTLKRLLTSEQVLRLYTRSVPTELHTDASKEDFGAILLESFEGKLHLV